METIIKSARRAAPYLLVEVLLPGGSLVALAMFVYRNKHAFAKLTSPLKGARS